MSTSSSLRLICGLLASLIASGSLASGGTGGLGGLTGGTGAIPQRNVDESYEYGKAVYLGRSPDSEKMQYCVLVDGLPKKLKRRTLKPYRNKTLLDLANALYRCDDPTTLALTTIKREQVAFVLYYLNKRYKLKLTDV